jgi:AcrR family transcriptional regulator
VPWSCAQSPGIEADCIRIFADKQPGKTAGRPELAACPGYLRAGDTLVIPGLDRLSRPLQDLITIVAGLRRRGTGFRSLHEALDTTTPGGRLVFHVFAALAEFIRELIVGGFALPGAATRQHRQAAALLAWLAAHRTPRSAQISTAGAGVRGAAEDRELTQLRMPGYPAGTAAGRGTP